MASKKQKFQFTKVFTEARERIGVSTAEVAKAAGLSTSTLYRAINENGAALQVSSLEAIATAVDVEPVDFWG
jgi:transcriptional regulator with XRE-family HTH domain